MLTSFKPKSEFNKNVLTLMTGTTIAQNKASEKIVKELLT